jgi:hypothetical protein
MTVSVTETQVALSVGQAAGTTPLVAANPNRRSLTIGNPGANVLLISVTSGHGAGEGIPMKAADRLTLGGPDMCPTNAIYCIGTVADKITIWEA